MTDEFVELTVLTLVLPSAMLQSLSTSDNDRPSNYSFMNLKFLRFCALIAILAFLLLAAPRLHAQPAGPANLLRQAYVTLSLADHDYKGHRVEAMKQIEAAAKLLRVGLHGDGRGHEKQGVSDEQLRTARNLLEQARTGLKAKPLKHVDRAINQINIALKIR
jgi:hypothetical protein